MKILQILSAYIISIFSVHFGFCESAVTVVPIPASVEQRDGTLETSGDFCKIFEVELIDKLCAASKISDKIAIENGEFDAKFFEKNFKISARKNKSLAAESYILTVGEKIEIEASDRAGLFYAIQTLRQMKVLTERGTFKFVHCKIEDSPRFAWRSCMVDIARNFLGKDFLYETIDQLALLKFNVLHLHLTDHQGWRIEIKKYPKLTEIGAFYCSSARNGYLTQDDARKLVEYAAKRNITIVPEIEILSHATAAVKAYPFLGHGFGINVGDKNVREFFQDVLVEIMDIFPSSVIHLAGDEVDYKIWGKNPSVASYIKERKLETLLDAHVCYMDEMGKFLESHGRQMMAWDESFGKGVEEVKNGMATQAAQISKNVIMDFWTGNVAGMTDAARKGHKIVNADCRYTYYNYYYTKDEKTYLPPIVGEIVDGPTAGYDSYLHSTPISLKRAYEFNPIPEGLDADSAKNIIGTSCQIWFKAIDSVPRFYDRAFPRVAAHAELAWSKPENKNYTDFLRRLVPLKRYWDIRNIPYNRDAQ